MNRSWLMDFWAPTASSRGVHQVFVRVHAPKTTFNLLARIPVVRSEGRISGQFSCHLKSGRGELDEQCDGGKKCFEHARVMAD